VDNDNQGFCKYIESENRFVEFFAKYPGLRLFGEWMVPHTLKTYVDEVWGRFWVFDVIDRKTKKFIPYEEYVPLLEEFSIDYIPVLGILDSPTVDDLYTLAETNKFMIKEGAGIGEGIVVKNYDFVNRYGRVVWGKLVRETFQETRKELYPRMLTSIEDVIARELVTEGRVAKLLAKLEETGPLSSKRIPELLGRIWYEVVTEEMWNVLKAHHNPTINFNVLNRAVIAETKKNCPLLFGGV
jgi:hypothetical protein